MLDVHPPNEPVHGWRDFFIHLITITIGLVIALSLERLVELRHRDHLMHEAETALHVEIEENSKHLQQTLQHVEDEEKILAEDVVILNKFIANPKVAISNRPRVEFSLPTFNDVSWKTAQSTGALSYMPYERAHEYGDLYDDQNEVNLAERQAARDAIASLATVMNLEKEAPKLNPADAGMVKQRIELFQAQLIMVYSLITNLDGKYKAFLAAHRDEQR